MGEETNEARAGKEQECVRLRVEEAREEERRKHKRRRGRRRERNTDTGKSGLG